MLFPLLCVCLWRRSVQMLWAGLGDGDNSDGRVWLLGQQHQHLAPCWHSVLGLSLGFDDVLISLLE